MKCNLNHFASESLLAVQFLVMFDSVFGWLARGIALRGRGSSDGQCRASRSALDRRQQTPRFVSTEQDLAQAVTGSYTGSRSVDAFSAVRSVRIPQNASTEPDSVLGGVG